MKSNLSISLISIGLILFIFMSINSSAQLNWVKYENNPVLEGTTGNWNENIFYPVVIHEENTFKIWYCGWKDESRQIGYAYSDDGINWNMDEDPVIPEGNPGDWDWHRYPGTVLRIDDTVRMWYSGSTNSADNFSIGYAWADEENEWNLLPVPVLEKGDTGEWDALFVLKPSVYFDGSTYHMYYTGMKTGSAQMNIGYATSDDGITWVKFPDPVMTVGENGSFYDSWITSHGLIYYNDTLRMFYEGFDGTNTTSWPYYFRVGYAWSTDYTSWNIVADFEPVLDVGYPGSWDEHWSGNPTVLIHNDSLKMWYTGFRNGDYLKIGYAMGEGLITGLPNQYELRTENFKAFPNPFNDQVSFSFQLQAKSMVKLELFNYKGQLISTLVNEVIPQGDHEVILKGMELKSGVYFCVLKTNNGVQSTKMIKL